MEQRITTSSQQKWLAKLMGLDFEVQYKKGAQSKAADALSRKFELNVITAIIPGWIQELKNSYEGDAKVEEIIAQKVLQGA